MNLGGAVHFNKTGTLILLALLLTLLMYIFNNTKENAATEHKVNLKMVLQVAIKAAQNGGLEVFSASNNKDLVVSSKGKTKEGMDDSVTSADYKSHCSMKNTFETILPQLQVVSEEAKTDCDESQHVDYYLNMDDVSVLSDEFVKEEDIIVWIDPLDATHEYTGIVWNYCS